MFCSHLPQCHLLHFLSESLNILINPQCFTLASLIRTFLARFNVPLIKQNLLSFPAASQNLTFYLLQLTDLAASLLSTTMPTCSSQNLPWINWQHPSLSTASCQSVLPLHHDLRQIPFSSWVMSTQVLQPLSDSIHSLSWRMFYVLLRRMTILLLLDGMFCACLLDIWSSVV